jgi:hypothetical protein
MDFPMPQIPFEVLKDFLQVGTQLRLVVRPNALAIRPMTVNRMVT